MPSFARKYRPMSFDAVVGQPIAAKLLSGYIRRGRAGHVLLSGEAGVGKTTCGRLYARALNCEAVTQTFSPCNRCEACQASLRDEYPDYIEFDGGTLGQKEQIVRLTDIARRPPLLGKRRVVLIEEAQGLSDAAWDSLLKIMEEPPPFLTFIFTTTRREKIKASVASRCAPLTMAKVPVRESVAFLTAVCEEEGILFGEDALRLIAHLTKGNVREAVQKLEDTTLLGDATVQNVRDLFGLGYVENLVIFWSGLIKGDLAEALGALETWSDDPPGVVERCREFMLYLQCRFLHRGVMTVNPVFDVLPPGDMKRLSDAIEERGSFAGLTIEQAYAAIHKVLAGASAYSDLGLQLLARDLHAFLHLQALDPEKMGRPADTMRRPGVAAASGQRRRQFVPTFNPEGSVAVAVTATPVPVASAPPPVRQGPITIPAFGRPQDALAAEAEGITARPAPAPAPAPAPVQAREVELTPEEAPIYVRRGLRMSGSLGPAKDYIPSDEEVSSPA